MSLCNTGTSEKVSIREHIKDDLLTNLGCSAMIFTAGSVIKDVSYHIGMHTLNNISDV